MGTLSAEIVLCGGPFNGSTIVVKQIADVEVLTRLEERQIDVYRRDADALAYYWDENLSALYTKEFDHVYASLARQHRPLIAEEPPDA